MARNESSALQSELRAEVCLCLYVYLGLCVFVAVCLFVFVFLPLLFLYVSFVSFFISLFACFYICLSFYLYVLYVQCCSYICLCVCLFVWCVLCLPCSVVWFIANCMRQSYWTLSWVSTKMGDQWPLLGNIDILPTVTNSALSCLFCYMQWVLAIGFMLVIWASSTAKGISFQARNVYYAAVHVFSFHYLYISHTGF